MNTQDKPTSTTSTPRPVNQKMMLLKLKRINELNGKLKESLSRDRIYASNASYSLIAYAQEHKDYTIPEVWGFMAQGQNPFRQNNASLNSSGRGGANGGGDACCTIM